MRTDTAFLPQHKRAEQGSFSHLFVIDIGERLPSSEPEVPMLVSVVSVDTISLWVRVRSSIRAALSAVSGCGSTGCRRSWKNSRQRGMLK